MGANYQGENSIIGNFVTILDDSIVPPGVNIPENTIYGGRPARFIKAACDMHEVEIQQYTRMVYDNMYSAISDYFRYMTQLKRAKQKEISEEVKDQKAQDKEPGPSVETN